MTTMPLAAAAAAQPPIAEPWAVRARWALQNTWVLTRRSISRIRREPESLLDVTLQPVIFVLLFTYVFGSAIRLPGGGSYHQYLISGMFGMTMAGTAPGTAVGLVTDMSTGLIDRFRSLPMSRAAVLATDPGRPGHAADRHCVLAVTGLAVGWRVLNGPARRWPRSACRCCSRSP
jgi:hypothetical protein